MPNQDDRLADCALELAAMANCRSTLQNRSVETDRQGSSMHSSTFGQCQYFARAPDTHTNIGLSKVQHPPNR